MRRRDATARHRAPTSRMYDRDDETFLGINVRLNDGKQGEEQ